MKICFVTAPTATEFKTEDELASKSVLWAASQPSLGILSLASVLLARGGAVQVIDLNHEYLEWVQAGRKDSGDFAAHAAQAIAEIDADLYGFGSICSSYPLTIRIAKALKAIHPRNWVILGGPQASVVDVSTLQAFPFVNMVLRGEAEQTLPTLLEQLAGDRRLHEVAALTYREGDQIRRNANAPIIDNLDTLPLPAYQLVHDLHQFKKLSLELGRGCPYACSFCSTNDFFRRKFRLRSPERVLSDMRAIYERYGIEDFELVHDMFTIDRRRVVEFCEAMFASGEEFTWSCSARTDSVDEELLALMAKSGCTGIFYGVEVGSIKMQSVINKNLDPTEAHEIIDATERLGIRSTVSMISGFPEETCDDLHQTVSVYMHSARCAHSNPQFNLLAPLADTPIYTKYKHGMVLEELCSDMSHQAGCNQNTEDLELIQKHPQIFPNFYALPTAHLDRSLLLELREFLVAAIERFRWLIVAIDQSANGILEFFQQWRSYRIGIKNGQTPLELRSYYRSLEFHCDFQQFVRLHPIGCREVIKAFLEYEDVLSRSSFVAQLFPSKGEIVIPGFPISPSDTPARKPEIVFMELSCDIQQVIDCLKRRSEPKLTHGAYFYIARAADQESSRFEQISSWLGKVLRACDGNHTVQEITELVGEVLPEIDVTHRGYVIRRLLEGAQSKGLIEVSREHEGTEDTEAQSALLATAEHKLGRLEGQAQDGVSHTG